MKSPIHLLLRRAGVLLLASILASSGCAHLRHAEPGSKETALDRYVAKPDPSYAYSVLSAAKGEGYTSFVVDMTSQTWRTPEEVDRTVWKHWLVIAKPDEVKTDVALLFINGGDNGGAAPEGAEERMARIAMATGSVVADLRMVPNQPLVFAGDGIPREEDAMIVYTWDKYLRTGDETWPARLPMTKSAVRAMDTVTSLLASDAGGKAAVERFVVAGGSKRGWTTWTTAAVDKRVVAICPIVIDMLNLVPSFMHHWEVYGFWAPAVNDYVEMGIMNWMGTPEYEALMKIEEPYEYRSRFTMPKLILNASGDQFFLPDSSQFYFDDLPGETLLRYVPNTGHSMRDTDALESLLSFYQTVIADSPRPRFTWAVEKDNSIRVTVKDKPASVALWQATNPDARDFRVDTIGKAWTSTALPDQGGGVYVGAVTEPPKGWTAFFVELTYPTEGPVPLKLTTQVHVVPDKAPFTYTPPQETPEGFLSK
ncbi:MAG: PhoPQ-activated pathogenicity-related family protein [Candidatus Hydrogenedentes bacterium]|nr:PhoPQ-activated pathogenicity-related family protein [Candidatus Hydrogenedentota bacterium]